MIPGVPFTAVPAIQFTPQGITVPSDTDILAGEQEDINTSFGGGVNPQLTAPQGQLASSITAIISDKDGQIAQVVNNVDPMYATGRFQDAIGRIYYLTRKGATATVVSCIVAGLPTTVIPQGTLAQDTAGNTYILLSAVTIGDNSSALASFSNVTTGPIPCPEGSLSKVYQQISGWDTITNPSDGSLGQNVETPSEFEFRRQNSVAKNSQGVNGTIYANVFGVADVLDCYVRDNPAGNVVDYGATNYPLAPHSLYVAVLGGDSQAVADAIWSGKSGGCDYNGNTTETVTDESGYNFPYPTYTVKFNRNPSLPIFFQVQIVNNPSLPSNLTTLVQNAIIARFNGTDTAPDAQRERIGGTVLAPRYYNTVSLVASGVVLLAITVGLAAAPTASNQPVGIDQTPTVSAADISVVLV